MFVIKCPFCGPRDEREFIYSGPIKAQRSTSLLKNDREWVQYLTIPINPLGNTTELWQHAHGCGQWISIVRNTETHEISDDKKGINK